MAALKKQYMFFKWPCFFRYLTSFLVTPYISFCQNPKVFKTSS